MTSQQVGILEWFWLGEHERAERVMDDLVALGVKHFRTGLSWADWHATGGQDWYRWLLPKLAERFEVLPCLLYTPPSLGVLPKTSSPPRRPEDFSDFLDVALDAHGELFEYVELWNEPNNLSEWDWTLDPQWEIFAAMIGGAAKWAHERGKKTVLGGMSPPDPNWLRLMARRGALAHIDVVGLHGFPGTWESTWRGWEPAVQETLAAVEGAGPEEVWITEAGYSTWRHDEFAQLRSFIDAIEAPVGRTYWYSAQDLQPERPTVDGFHTDEREYHFGLRRSDGTPKLLHRAWEDGGLRSIRDFAALGSTEATARRDKAAKGALITGGAGFVGVNVAERLLTEGKPVTILDNLSRPGVERNLRWLVDRYPGQVRVEVGDVRDRFAIRRSLSDCDEVFHFAAQVAVTTSLVQPVGDFDVNLQGTLNLLEEVRSQSQPASVLFTSTNKVYGDLPDIELAERDGRYEPLDPWIRAHGIDESRPLSFCSPYGCSKGGADQYVVDYCKSYGLSTVVFRMSCIYGPHQFGTEDQGWVAHFLIKALEQQKLTIYGDGKQVRDILYVDDLVDAMLLAQRDATQLSGQAFNIGGGPDNTVSLLELIEMIGSLTGARPDADHDAWRVGDQRYYVSDTAAFADATGWKPTTAVEEGVERLHDWLLANRFPGEPGRFAGAVAR